MDRLTIVLGDKTTIEELAKDPEVQIKIKDAIIEGIGRKCVKVAMSSKELKAAVQRVDEVAAKAFKEKFLEKGGWGGFSNKLTPEYQEIVQDAVRKAVGKEIEAATKEQLQILSDRVSDVVTSFENRVENYLNGLNLGKVIENVATKVIKDKLAK